MVFVMAIVFCSGHGIWDVIMVFSHVKCNQCICFLSYSFFYEPLPKPKRTQKTTNQSTNPSTNKQNQNPKPKQEENLNKKPKRQTTKPKMIQTTKQCCQILNLSHGWDLSFTFPQKIDYALATFTCQKYTVLIGCLLLLAVNKSQVSV